MYVQIYLHAVCAKLFKNMAMFMPKDHGLRRETT